MHFCPRELRPARHVLEQSAAKFLDRCNDSTTLQGLHQEVNAAMIKVTPLARRVILSGQQTQGASPGAQRMCFNGIEVLYARGLMNGRLFWRTRLVAAMRRRSFGCAAVFRQSLHATPDTTRFVLQSLCCEVCGEPVARGMRFHLVGLLVSALGLVGIVFCWFVW